MLGVQRAVLNQEHLRRSAVYQKVDTTLDELLSGWLRRKTTYVAARTAEGRREFHVHVEFRTLAAAADGTAFVPTATCWSVFDARSG